MKIGELAKQTDLRASTIRYYEKIGLLPRPEREGGQRAYDARTVDLLEFTKMARGLGYSLDDVKSLFKAFETESEPASVCQELARRKLAELDELIKKAQTMRDTLMQGLDCECGEIEECFLCAE